MKVLRSLSRARLAKPRSRRGGGRTHSTRQDTDAAAAPSGLPASSGDTAICCQITSRGLDLPLSLTWHTSTTPVPAAGSSCTTICSSMASHAPRMSRRLGACVKRTRRHRIGVALAPVYNARSEMSFGVPRHHAPTCRPVELALECHASAKPMLVSAVNARCGRQLIARANGRALSGAGGGLVGVVPTAARAAARRLADGARRRGRLGTPRLAFSAAGTPAGAPVVERAAAASPAPPLLDGCVAAV